MPSTLAVIVSVTVSVPSLGDIDHRMIGRKHLVRPADTRCRQQEEEDAKQGDETGHAVSDLPIDLEERFHGFSRLMAENRFALFLEKL